LNRDSTPPEVSVNTRRDFLKKTLYVAPVVMTASVTPMFARGAYNDDGIKTDGNMPDDVIGDDIPLDNLPDHVNPLDGGGSSGGGDLGGDTSTRRRGGSKRSNFFEKLWDQIREV
jgi:hypothetical protein